jgi:hypothetical protein
MPNFRSDAPRCVVCGQRAVFKALCASCKKRQAEGNILAHRTWGRVERQPHKRQKAQMEPPDKGQSEPLDLYVQGANCAPAQPSAFAWWQQMIEAEREALIARVRDDRRSVAARSRRWGKYQKEE